MADLAGPPQKLVNLGSPLGNREDLKVTGGNNRTEIKKLPDGVERVTRNDIDLSDVDINEGKLPQAPKRTIAVIDEFTNMSYLVRNQDGLGIVGHHGEAVFRTLKDPKSASELYNVSKPFYTPGEQVIVPEGITKSLDHILKTHKASGVSVVNMSLASNIPTDALNDIVKQHNPSGLPNGARITPDNVNEYSAVARKAIENAVSSDPKTYESYKPLLEAADKIEELAKQGVAVVVGGGNNGPNSINLTPIFAPNTIAVGGTEQKPGGQTQFHPQSARNSTIDAVAPFSVRQNLASGESYNILGTSISAPQVSERVVALQRSGVTSVPEINEILRREMNAQIGK